MHDSLVSKVYHLEHYAADWFTFLSHVHYSEGEYLASAEVSKDDEDYHSLGKFQSALDERIYESTLDGGCEEIGDAQFNGHHVLVPFTIEDITGYGILTLSHKFTNVPVGCIVTTTNSGAVDVTYYDTKAELYAAWDKCGEESNEYAQEGDAFFSSDRSGWFFTLEGAGLHSSFTDRREALFMLYKEMHKTGYFPNVWEVNDHGNEHPLLDTTEAIAEMLQDYVEFRDEQDDE